MTITTHARRLTHPSGRPDGWEATLVLTIGRRWLRLGAFYGTPPGSHIGLWLTRYRGEGSVTGPNLRIGRRYIGPCLTLLAHTKRLDP